MVNTSDHSPNDSLDQSSSDMSRAESETPGSALGPETPALQMSTLRCFSREERSLTSFWRLSLSVTSQGPMLPAGEQVS